ncbi:MAG: cytochrome c [Verrucomicrobiaceae bacterium]|nr:cytochrome c [Verrucomicrobiaceae bacterium]
MHLSTVILLFSAACVLAAEPLTLDFNRYMEGKYLFERNCIVCHGPRGDGNGEMAPTLSPRPRSFREGMFKFRTTPFGALPTEDDLRHTIKHGLTGTAMGMFAQLSEEDVTNVIEYVKSFSRRWRKEENYAEPLTFPEPPAWLDDPAQKAAHAEKGKALFATNCSACHGAIADGKGAAVPTLKDIWNQPARPSDLRQPHLRCGDRPQDIYRVLVTGLNGTPMVSFEAVLTPEQRWDIIAWLFTQKLPDMPTLGNAPPREVVKVKETP